LKRREGAEKFSFVRSIIHRNKWEKPAFIRHQLLKTQFSRTPGKNDPDNDPLQGRSLLKQVNHQEKQNAI